MTRTGDDLLRSLKRRRSGADRLEYLDSTGRLAALAKQLGKEAYESKAAGLHTQYALGAMAEVDVDYTRISIETADRVESQLNKRLAAAGYTMEFRRQGSVPLNVHIRAVSDVDLLAIESRSLYYSVAGVRAQRGAYTPAAVDPLSILAKLRSQCEIDLDLAFPVAKVDKSGDKAIKVLGGSLPRAVDVVPAVWSDTVTYQSTCDETYRGVAIYHKGDNTTIENLPFLHIRRIADGCNLTRGSLRKAIRLCKNIKADVEEEGTRIDLSSYEIAGLMYHADQNALLSGSIYELAILAEAQRHLDALWHNQEYAKTLDTPDGSRKILDEPRKITGLLHLSTALDNLLTEVAREQSPAVRAMSAPAREDARRAVRTLSF